jgi:hypothetical protein
MTTTLLELKKEEQKAALLFQEIEARQLVKAGKQKNKSMLIFSFWLMSCARSKVLVQAYCACWRKHIASL